MVHYFYVHSNICIITVYESVFKILEENKTDKIVILVSRGCSWPVNNPNIKVVDCQKFELAGSLHLRKEKMFTLLHSLFSYRRYLKELYSKINEFVAEEDFYIYLPIYDNELSHAFVQNEHCKGYYFIEEGSIDYLPLSYVYKIAWRTKQALFKRIVYPLLGSKFYFILHQGQNFLGCISLYKEAFPFIDDKIHIVNGNSSYVSQVEESKYFDNIIVTGYLFEDEQILRCCILKLLQSFNNTESIAFKIHPEVYSYYPEKIRIIKDIIRKSGKKVELLGPSYSVEASIFKAHSNIYSLFTKSSLLLYALKNNASAYAITMSNGNIEYEKFSNINEVITSIVTNSNYK